MSILLWTSIAGSAVILFTLAALSYGSLRGSIPLRRWGFSHGRGMWLNLALAAFTTVLVFGQLPPTKFTLGDSGLFKIVGAVTEELVFRVYLIRVVATLLSSKKGHVTKAVFLCAVVFTAMHLFRGLPATALLGLFISSLLLGYITYYTRSVLFAAYLHVLANTGSDLGLFGGAIVTVAYLAVSLYSIRRENHAARLLGSEGR